MGMGRNGNSPMVNGVEMGIREKNGKCNGREWEKIAWECMEGVGM